VKISLRVALSLLILCSCFPSFGQNKGLDFFKGKWNFKIWFSTNKSEKPDLSAIWILEKSLDSTECFTGHVEINGTVFTREIIAFNPVPKEYARTIIANNGAYIILKTKGWNNDKLTWEGTQSLQGQETKLKEEILKLSANKFKATFYNFRNNTWEQTQTEYLSRIE
jgi:hypothetical protein